MILMRLLVALAMISFATTARAGEWHKADAALSKQVINCLIDNWLRSSDQSYFERRYDVVVRVVSIDQYRVQDDREKKRFQKARGRVRFCEKGKQRDFHVLLMKDGEIAITNGRPVAKDRLIHGVIYGIMDVYQKGNELAIYVQSGGYSRKLKKSGRDCVYDATSSGARLHFRNRQRTIAVWGGTDLWVADVGLPTCMTDK